MAYGVKYRLNFADIFGKKRRLEILKKDYSGSVLPLYSNGEPVVISTNTDNDFYEPIIGSECTINLLVTDTVTYDNFYEYDEREYQVKVWYESSAGSYSLYWQGWISNDVYQQAMISTPYTLTINANDGLGTLGGFNTYFPTSSPECTLWELLYKNLQNIGLEQNISISNDIRLSYEISWKNVFIGISIKKQGVFHDNYILNDAKTMIRSILMANNCKIFQSNGHLTIVNCSSYGDQRIIAGVQAGTYYGAGILSAKQGFLNSGSEEIKFYTYNYLGNEIGNSTTNLLKSVKLNLTPVDQSLFKEIRRPLKKYEQIVDITQQKIDLNDNASFEFDMENWSVVAGAYSIDSTPFAGLKNFRFTDFVSTDGLFDEKLHSTYIGSIVKGNKYDFICSVRCDTASTIVKVPWYVRYYDVDTGNYIYWVDNNGSWSANALILWNSETLERKNKYVQIKSSPNNPPSSGDLEIGIGIPYINGVSVVTFIDNLAIRNNDEGIVYQSINFNRTIVSTIKNSDVLTHENITVANTTIETFLGAFIGSPVFKRCNDSTGITMEEIVTQQRLNDFRLFSVAYDGSFVNNDNYKVVTMANKIWINFSNFQESDSAIIDSLSYSVKSGKYQIRCHIPNNYTDVNSTFIASFQE